MPPQKGTYLALRDAGEPRERSSRRLPNNSDGARDVRHRSIRVLLWKGSPWITSRSASGPPIWNTAPPTSRAGSRGSISGWQRHLVSIVPGTFPRFSGERNGRRCYTNRAWLFTPGGEAFCQDKLALTPLEERAVSGVTRPGDVVQIIPWMGLRIAVVVCLDVEDTSLWGELGRLDLDLILVPAKTDMMSGYYRVFGCARARAIELQTAVCVVAPARPRGSRRRVTCLRRPSEALVHREGRSARSASVGPA